MSAQAIEYDAVVSGGVIDAASAVFVRQHYVFGRLWKWVLAAALVNLAAFCIFLAYSTDRTSLVMSGVVAALGPLYFLQTYVFTPRGIARRLRLRLSQPVHVTIDEEKLNLTSQGQTLTKAWPEWKAIREYPGFFLLVLPVGGFFPLSKQGMPPAALDLLRARLR